MIQDIINRYFDNLSPDGWKAFMERHNLVDADKAEEEREESKKFMFEEIYATLQVQNIIDFIKYMEAWEKRFKK